ncbi:HDIG domain-containing protein [Pseudodesulfovibrio cashew]|uniref:HDIG domain-containing protein n=1 Tax=Pseudodesulfovibrio cashew TaxID=2678688 RepID=A0A6I6JIE7_9BACT|nr:HDIG domain-containing metalloprotein [Pseudodesulfovibrio cashew]QGY40738.1 HDIG domain-containing protein [Pseudodesulfovibrio cashew]
MNSNVKPEIVGEIPVCPLPAPPPVIIDPTLPVPDDRECATYWERYKMLDNVAEHSREVARVATFVAERGKALGLNVDVATVRASALLHDIAKTYTIRHGGNHSQLGGAWTMDITGNPAIAVGITHHVYWHFAMDIDKYFTPLAVIYADKRVRHNRLVSIETRFKDLTSRYGINDYIRRRIEITRTQSVDLENLLSDTLEVNLNECDFDSGRLV